MIPPSVKEQLKNDPLFRSGKCCLFSEICAGRIEWHHAVSYGNGKKRIQEAWAIVPLCHAHHLLASIPDIKDRINWIVINRVTDEIAARFPKIDWVQMWGYLSEMFASEQL